VPGGVYRSEKSVGLLKQQCCLGVQATEKRIGAEKNKCNVYYYASGKNSDLPGLDFRRIGLFELFSRFCGGAIGTVFESAHMQAAMR